MKQHGETRRLLPTPDTQQEDIYIALFETLNRELARYPRPSQKAETLLNLGMIYRTVGLCQQLLARYGNRVLGGPFKGMQLFPDGVARPLDAARLCGMYEYELHPVINHIIATRYDTIINVGCAEGYYAVGLACALPQAHIIAADIEAVMLERTRHLAEANGVSSRVQTHGEIKPEDFATLAKGRTLILCDIEGAEDDLLDPAIAPALLSCDMLVEEHEVFREGVSSRLRSRFAATHMIETIEPNSGAPVFPDDFKHLSDNDRYAMTFVGRQGYTPWGFYRAKSY